jgi:peptidoglycan/LPS O-acetylase OafA/YrhL
MPKDDPFATLEARISHAKIPALDGIRALAIALVVLDHLHLPVIRNWEEPLGRTGVTLFFVLSGFLITWWMIKEDDRTGTISLGNFYVRRFLRIFPGFYCFWLLYVGLGLLAHTHISWGNCIAALFYVNNYYWPLRGAGPGAMTLTWSLGVEEQFYLIWPAIFRWLRGHRSRLIRALVVLCALVLLHRILLLDLWHAPRLYLYTAFDTRMDSLAIGCLLAISIRQRKAIRFVRLICAHGSLPAVTFALFALSIAFSSLARGSSYWCVWGFSIEPILSAILIIQLVVLGDRFPWAWINWNWVRFLGAISYSLYLYNAIGPDLVDRSPLAHTPLRVPASLLASLLLAAGSYYIIERPFLKLKSKYQPRSRPRVQPVSDPLTLPQPS